MFMGLGGGRDRDQNFNTCWSALQLGFKYLFILSLAMCVLSLFLGGFVAYLPNIVTFTVQKFQIWRLITSFLVSGSGLQSLISVLFNFYMLYMCIPDIQRKYSTAYIVLQVLLQTLTCNLALTVIGYPLIYLNLASQMSFVGYGVIHLVLIFLFQRSSSNPDEPSRFCFLPCLIPQKYIPWCFVLLLTVFGNSFMTLAIYSLIGYFQFMVRKKAFIQLPLAAYRKFDIIMPNSIKQQPGFVKVQSVQTQLKTVCLQRGCFQSTGQQRNPFNRNAEQIINDRVEVIGRGVAIGGNNIQPSNNNQFRNHWVQRNEISEVPKEKNQQKSAQLPKIQPNLLDAHEFDPNESMMSNKPFTETINQQEQSSVPSSTVFRK